MKLELTADGHSLDAIGFSFGHIADQLTPGVKVSVVGDLQVNEWNGNKKPQLLLSDIRSNEWQLFDLRGMREPSRWLPTIPVEDTLFVAFHEQTIHYFQSSLRGIAIQLIGQSSVGTANHLVVLDIPDDGEQLEKLVATVNPQRIYAHFHAADSKYFDGLPGRDQFGWYYSFLKKRGEFDMTKNGEQLTAHKAWKKDTVYFMSKVFSELGFVKIENGLVSVMETVGKRDLSEAPSYQERERQMELEKILLYAPYMELKQWFDASKNGTVGEEEQ